MKYLLFLLLCSSICRKAVAQKNYFPIDTLNKNALELEKINYRALNIYKFNVQISSDSVFLMLPKGLPRGYYEVCYDNNPQQLALIYYNYGAAAYCQQFYKNGAMKSDSEYHPLGVLHGVHVLYSREGDEIWHAEYTFGELDKRYRLDYLEVENSTLKAIRTQKAFGTYIFEPTPSRARRDKIELRTNGHFLYWASHNDCHYCLSYTGRWRQEGNFIVLQLSKNNIWQNATRQFAILATPRLTGLELIEVKEWGVEWYHSEYKKISSKTTPLSSKKRTLE